MSCDNESVQSFIRGAMWVSVLALLLLAPLTGHAKREQVFAYPYSRVWTTAVRLMRVDFEANITEKDRDDGYFLFEYPERGKNIPGSMELVAQKNGDNESVRVVLQIPALPTYVENMILERLAKKLEQEFGAPKEPKRPEPPRDKDKDKDKVEGEGGEGEGAPDGEKPKGGPGKKPPAEKG